jgi:hypothetical protein
LVLTSGSSLLILLFHNEVGAIVICVAGIRSAARSSLLLAESAWFFLVASLLIDKMVCAITVMKKNHIVTCC